MNEKDYQAGLERLRQEWGSLSVDPSQPGVARAANDKFAGILVGRFAAIVVEIINRAINREDAREAFLGLIADAEKFVEHPDGDETGDVTTFEIVTGWRQLAELAKALGIEPAYGESIGQTIERAVQA